MQLALAMSFASGRINAANTTRYVRRLELDMETIALNRTIVGFSHGSDTFGWRFMPRVQSPPESSNATVLFRDMLWGGPSRDDDLRQRQLEPGQRECSAIVVMPSFVPYVMIDTRSNWFPLTNCRKSEITIKDTVRLSKLIRSMQCNADLCMEDQQCYRAGEVYRMLKRVDQLSAELPLQTQTVQVPYENTLGGFEMFSNGTSDLAPQLLGYYGAPGIDPRQETHLFLVGDHFSVHETQVIAGNMPVDFKLLSRQVMHAIIPAGVRVINRTPDGNGQASADADETAYVVDVHVATPYGMTSHLEIPVAPLSASIDVTNAAGTGFRWDPAESLVTYTYHDSQADMLVPAKPAFVVDSVRPSLPNELVIMAPSRFDVGPAVIQLVLARDDNTLITDTPIELDAIPYDLRGQRYVINGANFGKIHARTIAQNFLDLVSTYPAAPNGSAEIRIFARIKSVGSVSNAPTINGYHTLTVKFKPKQ